MKALLLKNKYFLLGIILLILYLSHYIINGENSYITIHDFLDSNIANMNMLKNNNAIFQPNNIIPVFGGIPGNWLALPFDLRLIIFYLFSPYWAIVVNIYLIKTTALVGMYLLLKKYIIKGNKYSAFISACVGLSFALVPFYVDYGISSAGIPLLLYALFNLGYNKERVTSFLLIFYYGIYSCLALSGVFVCFLLFAYIIYYYITKKRVHLPLFTGLVLLSIIYVLVNLNLFLEFLFPHFISHRVEFALSANFKEIIADFFRLFVYSQYHAGLFFATPILIVFLILWWIKKHKDATLRYAFFAFLLLSILIFLGKLLPFVFPNIQIFKSFQFERFFFLFPALCFIILGIVIDRLIQYHRAIIAILLFGITSSSCVYCDGEFRTFLSSLTFHTSKDGNNNIPSFAQFYDQKLFDEIEKNISTSSRFDYKIACVGLYPSIAQFNQFETIDAYFFSYPLEYKHKFRKIIFPELKKSEKNRQYFDNWGSRCYIFSSELNGYLYKKDSKKTIDHLELNTEVLKELGTKFIFSSVEINNFLDLNFKFKGCYTTENSFWKIWVYEVM